MSLSNILPLLSVLVQLSIRGSILFDIVENICCREIRKRNV
jgi:hypothetical protein